MVSIDVYEETKIYGKIDRIGESEIYGTKITVVYECRRIEIKKYIKYEKKICLRIVEIGRCKLKLLDIKKKRII